MEKFTLKISGDTLTILLEYKDESDTLTLQKTNADVDNFPLCDMWFIHSPPSKDINYTSSEMEGFFIFS